MKQEVAITTRHRQESLVDLQRVDEPVQVVEASNHGHAGELVAWVLLLVHDSHHVVAVLRKHVHALDEHLAARPCADHEHAVGADALPPQSRFVLAQKVPLHRQQDRAQKDRVCDRQSGEVRTQIRDRDHSKDQERGQPDARVKVQQDACQRATPPRSVLLVHGQGNPVQDDDDRDRDKIGPEGQRGSALLADRVEIVAVPVAAQKGNRDYHGVPQE